MQLILYIVLAAIALLLLIAAIRAAGIKAKPRPGKKAAIAWTREDELLAGERLSKMIQVPSVSPKNADDMAEFERLQGVMRELFPLVHEKCERTELSGNLLYRLKGKNSSRSILLMGHQDVVPAAEPGWKHPAFAGVIEAGKLYGRGAVDCKCTVMSEFAAVEKLLGEGFVPECDVYLACSVNEEISGGGAAMTAQRLEELGVHPELVMDEGGAIADGLFPGIDSMLAVIGVEEKGFIDIRVSAKGAGGHASTPPRDNPMARLSAFITEMEKKRPFRREISPTVRDMFSRLAPHLPFGMRMLFGNVWLFAPVIKWVLPKVSPFGEALLATTFCFTMSGGSEASNVIPAEAYAVCNLRCPLHEGMAESVEVFRKMAAKYDLETEVLYGRDSSLRTSVSGAPFNYLVRCISECMPDVAIAPYLLMGGTDCREYELVSEGCLRFTPVRMSNSQLSSEHSVNENIDISALAEATEFYAYFIRNYK